MKSLLCLREEDRLERVRSRFGETSAAAEVGGMCISRRLFFKVTPLDGARPGSLWHGNLGCPPTTVWNPPRYS